MAQHTASKRKSHASQSTLREQILNSPPFGAWGLTPVQQTVVKQEKEEALDAYDREFIRTTRSVQASRTDIAAVLHDLCGVGGPLDQLLKQIRDSYLATIKQGGAIEIENVYWRVL